MLLIKKYIKIISSDINYKFLLLFILWLPLKDDYLPIILALWIFTWLLEGNFKSRINLFPHKPAYLGLLIYFLLTVFALFSSNDFEYGFFHVQEKLSMVFFPIFLVGASQKVKQNYKTILLVFILGNLIATIYCLANAFITNLIFENGEVYFKYWIYDAFKERSFWWHINDRYNVFYGNLTTFKHPAYFAMFLLFSIIILIYFLREKFIINKWIKIAALLVILHFTIVIYLLQSRAGLISLGLILLSIPIIEIQKKLKKRYFIYIPLFILVLSFIILSSSRINENVKEIKEIYTNPSSFSLSDSDIRLQVWYTSIYVIKDNFWLGTSPANLTDKLVIKYKELGFNSAAEVQLNTHNQFLETFAGLGVFGFISLIFILVYGFVISIKKHNYLLFFLFLILSINFLFESVMNRMAGILFMMFFMSLLVFANIREFEGKSAEQLAD